MDLLTNTVAEEPAVEEPAVEEAVTMDEAPIESDVSAAETEGFDGAAEDEVAEGESEGESEAIYEEGTDGYNYDGLEDAELSQLGEDEYYGDGLTAEMGIGGDVDGGSSSSFAPMSSWAFIVVMFVVAAAASVGAGILLAKRRIKKGISAYED